MENGFRKMLVETLIESGQRKSKSTVPVEIRELSEEAGANYIKPLVLCTIVVNQPMGL
jgi:hypothetical protein